MPQKSSRRLFDLLEPSKHYQNLLPLLHLSQTSIVIPIPFYPHLLHHSFQSIPHQKQTKQPGLDNREEETKSRKMFGVVFPDRSYPMDPSSFAQIDPLHWLLDMKTFVGEAYHEVKELCIFLLNAGVLPPEKALAVYCQAPGRPFVFCGAVHAARPSAVLSLPWPDPADDATAGPLQVAVPDAASAKIGVSVEDLAALPLVLDAGAERRVERLALRVGENLFNFMQSFCGVDGSRLVVPMDILDRWFKKFQEKAKKDPSYLKGFAL